MGFFVSACSIWCRIAIINLIAKRKKNNIKCRHDYNVLDMIYEGEKAETDREKVVQQLA